MKLMAHITQLIVDIKTGDASGADADGPVYLRVGTREFRLDKTGDQFKRNTPDHFVLGNGTVGGPANVKNPVENDPLKPLQVLADVLGAPVPINIPPGTVPVNPPYNVYIRYESNIKWLVESVTVRIIGDGAPSFDLTFRVRFGISLPGIWLGEDYGKFLYLLPP